MITLTLAMLRSFVADRVAAILTLVAPLAFFSLIALFYQHLEATDGFRFEIAVVDESLRRRCSHVRCNACMFPKFMARN